ncbi:YjjG family noncanonical pyrimidine nucleotidase [Thermosipho atlanticus]|uniref:Putative hydrolase of the HAD superfamily n=1 Tax=Thermosipho atlanticus DSM 15807 TaxID=1123380 RepID=A0A1M5T2Y7_9BACT|nr:YjjG family noncanonical pyrimidine nucleotidase [Thermosipho atlanticus]SHH45105.1 putative hydrolase of the HAD superfamily [Thermosipho atlanticus DSM 15807]
MKYTMIYFDLDNTILDFDKSEEYALKKVFEYFKLDFQKEFLGIYKTINEKWWKLFAEGKYPKETIVVERFKEFFNNIGINLKDYKKVSEIYLEHLSNAAIFIDGAEEFLYSLKSLGFRMAAITNGVDSVQQNRSKIARLDRFFEFVLTSEKVGKPKPEPDIFFYAEQITKIPLSESLYIGDKIETDYEGAKRANIDFILYDPKNKYNVDCKKATSYEELYKIIVSK